MKMSRLLPILSFNCELSLSSVTSRFLYKRCYCTVTTAKKTKNTQYSHTMNFGKVSMKARLPNKILQEHDLWIRKEANFKEIYKWQLKHKKGKEFILHDGPPYANGHLHMGHAVNKILKDVILRHKILQGHKVLYIPGWDCHGLPIELKSNDKSSKDPIIIRKKARKYATKMIELQKKEFSEWGLLADWDIAYETFTRKYVAKQMWLFLQLYEKGLVFQDVLPVNFSPSTQTVLAESEIEQLQHKTDVIYTAFPLISIPPTLQKLTSERVYVPIWTSKPWTLPMNKLVACSPDLIYCLMRVLDDTQNLHLLWAKDLIENFQKLFPDFEIIGEISGNELNGATYLGPFQIEERQIVANKFVTARRGTGLVHLSPAHGQDDFNIATQLEIPVINHVTKEGKYDIGFGYNLDGLPVIGEGDQAVINFIENNGDGSTLLLNKDTMIHSHPHDWRTKQPLITCALSQWFFNIEKIKGKCLEALDAVNVIPPTLKPEMMQLIKKRNYWCISRQRVWGVPIPIFYEAATKTPLLTWEIIEHLTNLITAEGTDIWWTKTERELLPPSLVAQYDKDNIPLPTKGTDILDIWFDSGSSWKCVLPESAVSHICLEGIDQISAWFQTSLFLSVAARGTSSYDSLYIHGFVVDRENRKMSKSLGNVVTPHQIMYEQSSKGKKKKKKDNVIKEEHLMEPIGADALRLWVSSSASHNNMSINDVNKMKQRLNKIRMTLKFMLSLIHKYDGEGTPDLNQLRLIDRYYLHRLFCIVQQVKTNYENLEFREACITFTNFISEEVGDVYLNIIKDRMHCAPATDIERSSGRQVVTELLHHLLLCIAPVLPHLAEEVNHHHPYTKDSLFKSDIINPPIEWCDWSVNEKWAEIYDIKCQLYDSRDWWKLKGEGYKHGVLLNSASSDLFKILHPDDTNLHSELCEILQVSEIQLKHLPETKERIVSVYKSRHDMCQRCWKNTAVQQELCYRCATAIYE